jgi:hypothetical protein
MEAEANEEEAGPRVRGLGRGKGLLPKSLTGRAAARLSVSIDPEVSDRLEAEVTGRGDRSRIVERALDSYLP